MKRPGKVLGMCSRYCNGFELKLVLFEALQYKEGCGLHMSTHHPVNFMFHLILYEICINTLHTDAFVGGNVATNYDTHSHSKWCLTKMIKLSSKVNQLTWINIGES